MGRGRGGDGVVCWVVRGEEGGVASRGRFRRSGMVGEGCVCICGRSTEGGALIIVYS